MTLNPASLASSLAGGFASPGSSYAACAQQWADSVVSYAAAITPPSTSVLGAKTALQASLAGAFAAPDAIGGMEAAFTQFAAAVGLGMAGFVPAPPLGPVGFAAQFGGPHPATHADAGLAIAGRIDTWLRTGSATPVSGGTPVPWL